MQCLRRASGSRQLFIAALGHIRNKDGHIARGIPLVSSPQHSRPLFSLSSIPAILLPPVVFTGLLITLWTYKCLMMVVFQNKIIYMPSIPPFSRSEKLEDYASQCRPVIWREHDLQAADGVALKLIEGKVASNPAVPCEKEVVVLYFQGNASSLPPRLPYLSPILKALQASDGHLHKRAAYTIFALSYRGFWKSRGRATQRGIELDAQTALNWLSQTMRSKSANPEDIRVVLWGQSVGAGVAITALASLLSQQRSKRPTDPQQPPSLNIHSLILETPFLSIRSMLVALYPQKFLPYRHLWPFLRSTWDSEAAIHSVARSQIIQQRPQLLKKVLILQAGRDEVVPSEQSEALERICRQNLDGCSQVERVVVEGALHTEILAKSKGRAAVVQHLRRVAGDD